MTGSDEHGEIDPLGPERHWANLTPMIGYLLVVGTLLTIAAWQDWAWAYILGLALTTVWVAGFVVVRNRPRRWFRW